MSTLSDPSEIVPVVGMQGIYTLKAPYGNLLVEQVSYTCIAVKNLKAALLDGEDPLNDIYLANGDTEENYQLDLAANHCLVVLQSSVGEKITVPTSAISGLPDADGVLYTNSVLAISLSALPQGFDLTGLQSAVEDMVLTQVGVKSTSFINTVGAAKVLSHTAHDTLEAARQARLVTQPSNENRVVQLTLQNQAMAAKITQLENYIKANLPP